MKAIALIVVKNGFANTYAPGHVDVRVVDRDVGDLDTGWKEKLPAGVGFEELVAEAGVEKDVEFCNDAE